MIKFLDIYNQDKKLHKLIIKDIYKLFKKGDFILGNDVLNFEKKFAKFCQSNYAISCANGTDALYLALRSLNLPSGSEVIVPAMTWISTISAIILNNLKPVLVDININDPLISHSEIKKKITKKTKAIIPVHLYGSPVDISEIKKIIKGKNIYIIDDAAQAHGAKNLTNKMIGSLTDLTCFSFYPGKNLGCYGDGGMITTNSKILYLKLKKMRNLGSIKKHIHDEIGINSRLDTLQALILSKKLPFLKKLNNKRKKIAIFYNNNIKNIKITKLKYSKNAVFHQYVIMIKNKKKLINAFNKNKIQYGFHYPKSINQLECFKKFFKNEKYPNAENLAKYCISIPIDPYLTLKEIKKIVRILNSL